MTLMTNDIMTTRFFITKFLGKYKNNGCEKHSKFFLNENRNRGICKDLSLYID